MFYCSIDLLTIDGLKVGPVGEEGVLGLTLRATLKASSGRSLRSLDHKMQNDSWYCQDPNEDNLPLIRPSTE
jgi:hypothetical protein